MGDAKSTSIPLGGQFSLTKEQSPSSTELIEEMKNAPYAMALGCLMYIMVSTRPDLVHSLSILSRFMANPGMEHWKALKWLLRYLKGTWNYGLVYEKTKDEMHLTGFVDADYASNKDTRRSTTAYSFMMNNSCICWKSQLQSVVALSTTEAQFMATTEAFKEAVWLQGIMQELKQIKHSTIIYSDSQSSIHFCKNPVYHEKSKHIDIRLYWIREKIEEGTIELEKIRTEENPADMGTKVVSISKFKHCLNLLNLRA
ncbi:secreted RxLR effector protein 161-like [Humulus lupulus]|uniref:secreted RxLR effector protein 161-like n=1 Tax=Humulus lupulus TaxID=3486 RepID=UPI002B418626|nr:secreted RxLR effector protein 161-like [Humulus lupulus]